MRKLTYLAITFSVCHLFGLGDIWLGFTTVLLLMTFFKFYDSFVWEIPLGVLSASVLQIAFADDIKIVVQFLILVNSIIIAYVSPKKIPLFFLISTVALFFENAYSISFEWGMLWYSVRCASAYFITKKPSLQEYKL